VAAGDVRLLELAGHAFFDQVAQLERDFRYLWRGDRGGEGFFVVCWEETPGFVAPEVAVCAVGLLALCLLFSSVSEQGTSD